MGPGDSFSADRNRFYRVVTSGEPSRLRRVRIWMLRPELSQLACFRFGQWAARRSGAGGALSRLVALLWRRRIDRIWHVRIDPAARIGPGLFIMHGYAILLGPVEIGANCVLHHNVTLGQRVAAGSQGVPRFGDNVWIGPGCTVTGDVTVGDGVTISAGTVLSKSVPAGALVAGNPGRVIQLDYDNASLMPYPT